MGCGLCFPGSLSLIDIHYYLYVIILGNCVLYLDVQYCMLEPILFLLHL